MITTYNMSQDLQLARRQIFDELTKIVDPEIGVSIMELELIDKVDIADGKVNVDLHLTSPFCPAVFGFKIAQDVKDNIYNVEGIHDVKVNVSNHFMAEAINKQVNESKPPQQQPAAATPTTTTDTSSSTLDSKAETAEKKQN
jgi:metal-sulfur cluster biosynthetic enzyme